MGKRFILVLAVSRECYKSLNFLTLSKGWQATVAAAPMLGYIPGGFVFGMMSDKFGRKPTFLISNLVSDA